MRVARTPNSLVLFALVAVTLAAVLYAAVAALPLAASVAGASTPAHLVDSQPDQGTCAAAPNQGATTGAARGTAGLPLLVPPPGWIAGDLHVHGPDSCFGVAPPVEIVDGMPSDLTVASVLLWGGGGFFEQNVVDYFSGDVDPISTPDKIIKYDLELSGFSLADRLGHLAGLGLTDIDFPRVGYQAPIQDWIHAQGGIVGSLHSQGWSNSLLEFPPLEFCCGPYELPIAIVNDRVDFLDYQGSQRLRWRFLWYSLLNCGFRPGIAATSDAWCLNEIGDYRTYARIDGEVTYEAFIQAVADGKTSVVELNDGFVDFTVGSGAKPGDQLDVTAGQPLDLTAELYLPEGVQRYGSIKIIKNGSYLTLAQYDQIGGVVTLNWQDAPTQSAWYAALTDYGHSGAVFVVVDGQPIRPSVEAPQYFIDYLDYLRDAIEDDFFYQLTPDERIALLADLSAAQSVYATIRDEAAQAATVADPPPSATAAVPSVTVWPTPFSSTLHIDVDTRRTGAYGSGQGTGGALTLEIFGADGRLLRSIVDPSGTAPRLTWDGRDVDGRNVPSGIYFYRVSSELHTVGTGRVVRVR